MFVAPLLLPMITCGFGCCFWALQILFLERRRKDDTEG